MFEIYAYGNVETLSGIFNAIAAIMGGADYYGLIRTIALTGMLVAVFSGLLTPGRFHGWGWFIGFMVMYQLLFLPKTDVVIVDRLGNRTPVTVANVPIGVAFFGHFTAKVGDGMTRFFETAFQAIPDADAQLPPELTYQRNGVLFGNRLIQASRTVNIADPQLRADLIAYVQNCTLYDLQDGTLDPTTFARSTDLWALMGNSNPARFTTRGNPVQVDTCPNVYTALNTQLPEAVNRARAILAFRMNPALDPTIAQAGADNQIVQAYTKAGLADAAQGAGDLLRQNILINLVEDAATLQSQRLNDPAALMIATARANATASTNASFVTMGRIAEQALPMVRNTLEAIIYAVYPFVFLLLLLAHGRALGQALKAFLMSLIWIQLWPPLYAVLNYVATLASSRNLTAAARMDETARGLALDTAAAIYNGAISDQAVAGYLVVSIPIIATAILKGGEVAFQAVTASAQIQSSATTEAASTTKGNLTQDAVSVDQQQLGPTRTSPHMTTKSDAWGTTIQGTGPDAGAFRYQATMSRLASTFTISERQATAIAESAKEAETFATTQRDTLQRSQATALTKALSIQDSYEKYRQRSGGSNTSDGGSTSTQYQTLNSVAKDVNRRLGLTDDSTVGKTVAASASAGAKIPFTEIGAVARQEGRHLDQQSLQSAYDYARHAVENAQVTNAAGLVREFRATDAYQWAKGSRTASTEGYDTSSREAVDHQNSTEVAYAKAKEIARTAQFMREWSSGTQTDFTNYAAKRLAERGLLKEEDPIALQRAVTEIAMDYAKGGDGPGGFVASSNPIGPERLSPDPQHWRSGVLATEYRDAVESLAGNDVKATEQSAHRNQLRRRQAEAGTTPTASTTDDVGTRLKADRAKVGTRLDQGRTDIEGTGEVLSDDYRRSVRIGKVSEGHGGNPAVWSTIGANASRPDLGRSETPSTPIPSNASQQDSSADDPKKRTRENDNSAPKPSPNSRSGTKGRW